MKDQVRAAGGVVLRDGLVALVHRPRYDDWTLPKGKADPGEDDETCALREVAEETGLRCRLGDELPSVRYHDRFGRAKLVRYWTMTPDGGSFTPTDEVDEIRWLPIAGAKPLLSYQRDIVVLDAFARR